MARRATSAVSFATVFATRAYGTEIPDQQIEVARAHLHELLADGLPAALRLEVWALFRAHPVSEIRALAGKVLARHAADFVTSTKRAIGASVHQSAEPKVTKGLYALERVLGVDALRTAELVFALSGNGLQFLVEHGGASAMGALRARLDGDTLCLGSNHVQHESDQIPRLPKEIASVTGFTTLNMFGCKCTELPPEIGELHLRVMDLSNNRLKVLPREVAKLTSLEQCELRGNKFRDVPGPLAGLPRLRSLGLERNPIKTLGPTIGTFPSLIELSLMWTEVSTLPPQLATLQHLRLVKLYGTPLANDPVELARLTAQFPRCTLEWT